MIFSKLATLKIQFPKLCSAKFVSKLYVNLTSIFVAGFENTVDCAQNYGETKTGCKNPAELSPISFQTLALKW